MKAKFLKFIRNTSISIGVLLVLFLGGGAAYTWYMGEYGDDTASSAIATPVELSPPPTITPTKPAPDAKVGASVQMLTSPVLPGSNASISVKTNAGAECSISVEYNKIPSTDSGLKKMIANDFGMVNWAWTVESSTPLGKWPVEVTCVYNDQSAMVRGELVVSDSVE